MKVFVSRINLIPSESQKNDNNERRTLSCCLFACVFVVRLHKMNQAEGTRHCGLAADRSEREFAACRPAEITQVSLSRLFSAFMTAKWREEEKKTKKHPDNKTTTRLPSKKDTRK